jgi:cytochrome c oxidase cbb3-type subunit 3
MTDDQKKVEKDEVSGVDTTGHEWDGLKELNNPLPRWWVWVFVACCVWAAWYWVVYPAWPVPSGATKGTSGYTEYNELKEHQAEIVERQKVYLDKFNQSSFEEIMKDPQLYAFAIAGGSAAFKDNCATCHGTGAEGGKGFPNLNDDDWLWGGKVGDIYQTISYGIRSGHEKARTSQMPSFGKDGILKKEEIDSVVDYVLGLSEGKSNDKMPGYAIFQSNCAACHGPDAKGGRDFGAPNLTDSIWLYGGTKEDVTNTVYNAHAGVMPTWQARLGDSTVRQLAIYVHQLGGGEKDVPKAVVETAPVIVETAPKVE